MVKPNGICLIVMFFFSVSFLFPGVSDSPVKPDPKMKVLTRSLFFPGLGQLYEKKYVKAAAFMSSEVFCIVQAFLANKSGDDYYWLYRFASSLEEVTKYRQLTEQYDRRRNTYLLIGAGIWIVNMIDALLHVKKKYPQKKELSIQPILDHEKNQISLALYFCF